jgi:hypothetical protein
MTEAPTIDLRVNDIKLLAAMLADCVLTRRVGMGKWHRGASVKLSHPDGRYREIPHEHLWRNFVNSKMIVVVSQQFPPAEFYRIETYGLTPEALQYLEGRRYRLDLDKYLEVKMTRETLEGMERLCAGGKILVTHVGGFHVVNKRDDYMMGIAPRQFETFIKRFLEPAGEHRFNKCKIFSFTDAGREWLAANVKPAACSTASGDDMTDPTTDTAAAIAATGTPVAAPPASALQQTVDTDLQAAADLNAKVDADATAALDKAKALGSDLNAHIQTLGASTWLTNAEVFVTNAIKEIEAHFKAAVAAVEKAI